MSKSDVSSFGIIFPLISSNFTLTWDRYTDLILLKSVNAPNGVYTIQLMMYQYSNLNQVYVQPVVNTFPFSGNQTVNNSTTTIVITSVTVDIIGKDVTDITALPIGAYLVLVTNEIGDPVYLSEISKTNVSQIGVVMPIATTC